jgi:NADH-quinone oxidoreductase subunit M
MPTLLILLLVVPLVAAIVAGVVGSRQALPALFGSREELAELVGPEAAEELAARAAARQDVASRRVALAGTLVALAIAVVVAWQFAAPRVRHAADDRDAIDRLVAEQREQFQYKQDVFTFRNGVTIRFHLLADGLSVWLVLLTALLMVPSVLISWRSVQERAPEFYAWLLLLQVGMTGVFLAADIILFYVFFELTLVPLFFLIGVWGGPERQYAARKFFVYTLTGSLITFLGVLAVVLSLGRDWSTEEERQEALRRGQPAPLAGEMTFSIERLTDLVEQHNQRINPATVAARRLQLEARQKAAAADQGNEAEKGEANKARERLEQEEKRLSQWRSFQFWVFVALMAGFAIKVPLVPLHTWLPLAHVEAPTAGSVLLAGILLKIGTYGFLRLCLPLAPDASLTFGAPLIGVLAVIGIIYGSACALAQDDFKKLVAYSSVAHLGYCMLGLFALNEVGLTGGLLQMINHGLSTGALFLLVGMIYERYHTRKIADYGGMGARLKVLSAFMVFITMSSVGLPGLNGFWGEVSTMMGMYAFGPRPDKYQGVWVNGPALAIIASFGVVLGAWYMLSLLRGVFFGEVHEPRHEGHAHAADLNGREWACLLPIAACCLVLGLYPKPFLDTVRPELRATAEILDDARARASGTYEPPEEEASGLAAGPNRAGE